MLIDEISKTDVVETLAQARPIFAAVRDWLTDQGLCCLDMPIGLELASEDRLVELVFYGLSGLATNRNDVWRVFVMPGYSSTYFASVLAHEIGHVWLIDHGVPYAPKCASEGFCDMLEHRLLAYLDTPDSKEIIELFEKKENRYRMNRIAPVLAQANAMGFENFLEQIKATKSIAVADKIAA